MLRSRRYPNIYQQMSCRLHCHIFCGQQSSTPLLLAVGMLADFSNVQSLPPLLPHVSPDFLPSPLPSIHQVAASSFNMEVSNPRAFLDAIDRDRYGIKAPPAYTSFYRAEIEIAQLHDTTEWHCLWLEHAFPLAVQVQLHAG